MAAIGFYHLTRSGPDAALPRLLGRTLAASQRAVVLCAGDDRVRALDAALWASNDPDWLPHGTAASGDADLQPIWLTATDALPAPNNARFLFLLDGRTSEHLAGFDRVFDLFDGQDAGSVDAARARWLAAKAAGHTLSYWQQSERGWEKAP
ncbi:MAG: DNA polymerase III subunit chi [Acetobacteraceae bacterium]|nr:DNA polymerase III subunit chi [Acetobacteraceae bacterium]